MSTPARVFLIDGSSQMYRAYHAMRGGGLTGPAGKSTHAVYIFVTMLRKLIADHAPQYIAASFDLAGPTFRSELATDYKANRSPMPPDLAEQIPWVHEACEALGVPILTSQRFEADDVIGTLAEKAVEAGFEVAIVTGDKDFFQLVHDGITVYNPKEDGTWYDAAGVKEKFGVTPEQVVDVLALMGDSIDNIKGVPGIGEKGARDLIATYGSLEALLAHAAEVSNKRYREGLLNHAEDARQSRELARIRTDVPVAVRSRGACAIAARPRERCFELFIAPRASDRWCWSTRRPPRRSARTTRRCSRSTSCAGARRRVEAFGPLRPARARLTRRPRCVPASSGCRFRRRPRHARYVPMADQRPQRGSLRRLADERRAPGNRSGRGADGPEAVLEDDAVLKVGHDLKFDAIVLAQHGITLAGLDTDVMIASYLLDANVVASARGSGDRAHRLQGAQRRRRLRTRREVRLVCRHPRRARARLRGRARRPRAAAVGDADRASEAGRPAARLRRARAAAHPGARRRSSARACASTRRRSPRRRGALEQELSRLAGRIYELAGEEFNINSPKKLSEILFDRLGMRTETIRRTTKTKAQSTAFEVLEELALTHELPKLILEWRSLQKLKGTYIDALPALVHPGTGRVHTCFNQAVAATGRLSSSDPNLQNIPIRTDIGREIRRAFVAEPGHVLISADYSQIELRVLAHLAKEQTLVDAFRNGEDIHDRTALKVFGSDERPQRRTSLRRRAKIINYALLYGKQAFTLAKDIGVSRQEAQAFIDAYFAGFTAVRAFHRRSPGPGARNRRRQDDVRPAPAGA